LFYIFNKYVNILQIFKWLYNIKAHSSRQYGELLSQKKKPFRILHPSEHFGKEVF
jgi:hypothetical protein